MRLPAIKAWWSFYAWALGMRLPAIKAWRSFYAGVCHDAMYKHLESCNWGLERSKQSLLKTLRESISHKRRIFKNERSHWKKRLMSPLPDSRSTHCKLTQLCSWWKTSRLQSYEMIVSRARWWKTSRLQSYEVIESTARWWKTSRLQSYEVIVSTARWWKTSRLQSYEVIVSTARWWKTSRLQSYEVIVSTARCCKMSSWKAPTIAPWPPSSLWREVLMEYGFERILFQNGNLQI
jgi:hypothetical protein